METTLYDVLGVANDATEKEIKKAFRALSKTFHPDVNDSDDAHDIFSSIEEAYSVLIDPEKRAHYDENKNRFKRLFNRRFTDIHLYFSLFCYHPALFYN